MRTSGYVSSPCGELFYEREGATGAPPLVCVHGGPGFTSYYLESLFELSGQLPVVCYDQAGCGRSRRVGGRKVFSVDGFVEELEALREALGVSSMHLLGHSFGGLIIGEYALRYPERARSAIFASASIDIPRWLADGQRLLSQLPLMDRMILREGLRAGNVHSPEFLRALASYYTKHVYGFTEKPESISKSEAEADHVTYQTVWGPNELAVTGLVRDYTLTPRLAELSCPSLFMCGRCDEATPEAHQYFASLAPRSACHIFEQSAHHPHITERKECLETIGQFLRSVEG